MNARMNVLFFKRNTHLKKKKWLITLLMSELSGFHKKHAAWIQTKFDPP
jgi:hypothetical protein